MELELRSFAESLAPHLDGFAVVPQDPDNPDRHYVRMRHPDGRSFTLHGTGWIPGTKAGQVHLSGDWPKDGDQYKGPREWGAIGYHDALPGINVSASRGAATVAADISRRFLAVYSPLYAKCLEQKAECDAYRDRVASLAAELARRLPLSEPRNKSRDDVTLYLNGSSYDVSGEVQPSDHDVTFRRLSLPRALALEVAELIGHYLAAREAAPEGDPVTV